MNVNVRDRMILYEAGEKQNLVLLISIFQRQDAGATQA